MSKQCLGNFSTNLMSKSILIICLFLCFAGQAYSETLAKEKEKKVVTESLVWKRVTKLTSEQKYQAALREVEKIRVAAIKKNDNEEWTKALIKEVQLRSALREYETAVNSFKKSPWPKDSDAQIILQLFYAHLLENYLRGYSWEIRKREEIETRQKQNLKSLSYNQIYQEILKTYEDIWKKRQGLSNQAWVKYRPYIEPNNYPPEIRGQLRDTITYFLAETLRNTAHWTPEEANNKYLLNVRDLVGTKISKNIDLQDMMIHPLLKFCFVLQDLEEWHTAQNRPEAALEARLERIRGLSSLDLQPEDRAVVVKDLISRLGPFEKYPWWSMGMALLTEIYRNDHDLVRAREFAKAGYKKYPTSPGGERCHGMLAEIEAPEFQMEAMKIDGLQKRSIQISYRNVKKIYFRAFQVDLIKYVEGSNDYNLLPMQKDIEKLLDTNASAKEWAVDLPRANDYTDHNFFVTPPLEKFGFYVIAASLNKEFSRKNNRILSINFQLSNLVSFSQVVNDEIDVQVVSGETGEPMAKAEVVIYKFDWYNHHQKLKTRISDKNGLVTFRRDELKSWKINEISKGPVDSSYFFVVKKDDQLSLDSSSLYFSQGSDPNDAKSTLIYTDRSIYRPGQDIKWKIITYQGKRQEAAYEVGTDKKVTVSLVDANGETVITRDVVTNKFGSASGEFKIPSGRVLGFWGIKSSFGEGRASFKVEEYKRPTFDVSLEDPKSDLRFNKKAQITGLAKYYFGLPLTKGKVQWKITREPVFECCFYFSRHEGGQNQIISTGMSSVGKNGQFEIAFTPQADERDKKKKIYYLFRIEASLTDEGGETRNGEKTIAVGFVGVTATLKMENSYIREKTPFVLQVTRSDLNGTALPGNGDWKLFRLREPEKVVLPADLPFKPESEPGKREKNLLPDDKKRSRWNTKVELDEILKPWPEDQLTARGAISHAKDGLGKINLPALEAGAYRFSYQTKDKFGGEYETVKDFLVAGQEFSLPLPALLLAEKKTVKVGEDLQIYLGSGLKKQTLFYKIIHQGKPLEQKTIIAGEGALISLPVTEELRGGFTIYLATIRDFQTMIFQENIFVPWDNKELKLGFETFRDHLTPGGKETWKVKMEGDKALFHSAELLAYMYDKSLDFFGGHFPPSALQEYPNLAYNWQTNTNLGEDSGRWLVNALPHSPAIKPLLEDRLLFLDSYGIGGLGRSKRAMAGYASRQTKESFSLAAPSDSAEESAAALAPKVNAEKMVAGSEVLPVSQSSQENKQQKPANTKLPTQPEQFRKDFSETAFFKPHLLFDDSGIAVLEFDVPDSVTAWKVWLHAVTLDLKAQDLSKETVSSKDLMIRPYLPRFFREGDLATLKVSINNALDKKMEGTAEIEIFDQETGKDLATEFKLDKKRLSFTIDKKGSTSLGVNLEVPRTTKLVGFKVKATSGNFSDGEQRIVPILPSRVHLTQSRFVTLANQEKRTIKFPEMAKINDKKSDKTRINEQLVIGVDGQLIFTVLKALPFIINYPYESTDYIFNKYFVTGILHAIYQKYPAVKAMAASFKERKTPLESFSQKDPNRKMMFEETPWLELYQGGKIDENIELTNVFDENLVKEMRESSLAKLKKLQTSSGGFPWFPGGPPSPFVTLYILYGFARASEFGLDIPSDIVPKAWEYLAKHCHDELLQSIKKAEGSVEFLTFLNYVVSAYPPDLKVDKFLTKKDQEQILKISFSKWQKLSPYIKAFLALTLKRAGRDKDAKLVFEAIMDSAKSKKDEGMFWAAEDRSWLWYNDTVEGHSFALKTLMEFDRKDKRRHDLVLWLLLHKKLNHWKSTRATTEAIYSLAQYFKDEDSLGIREEVLVEAGDKKEKIIFEPDKYTGKNTLVFPGSEIDRGNFSNITFSKETKGFAFGSAAWHFSTDQLPKEDQGDFFKISRTYFLRTVSGKKQILKPLGESEEIRVGDEIEVHISISTKHPAEYVHLKDPRAAGMEPSSSTSSFKWDLGIGWYEEIRDSGANFFFEALPKGQYTFKYRLRASMSGTFRVGPATLQSLYAPEFTAYTKGQILKIR